MNEIEEKAIEDIKKELEVSKKFPYLHTPREMAKRLVLGCGYGKVKGYQEEIMDLTAKLEATKQDKENLKRTIEEMNEALEASGISIDVDGDVVYENVKQAVRAFAERLKNLYRLQRISLNAALEKIVVTQIKDTYIAAISILDENIKEIDQLVKEVCGE